MEEEKRDEGGPGKEGKRRGGTAFLNDQDQFESPARSLLLFLALQNHSLKAGDVPQLVECLSSMHEALGLTPSLHKLGMVSHTCQPSTRLETAASEHP